MDAQKRNSMSWLAGCALSVATGNARSAADPVVLRIYFQAPTSQAEPASKAAKPRPTPPPVASYDMAFLKSLPQRSFKTHTPWYKNPVTFTGPLLRDVLAAARVKGTLMYAVAIDDYRAQIPFSDCLHYDMILAHQIDEETLTPKNKGPLFVVYPYDSRPELQSIRFYERSIWQLKSLRVE
jgi:hypothetical protein